MRRQAVRHDRDAALEGLELVAGLNRLHDQAGKPDARQHGDCRVEIEDRAVGNAHGGLEVLDGRRGLSDPWRKPVGERQRCVSATYVYNRHRSSSLAKELAQSFRALLINPLLLHH